MSYFAIDYFDVAFSMPPHCYTRFPALKPHRFLSLRSPRHKVPVTWATPTRVSQEAGALLCKTVNTPDFEHPSGQRRRIHRSEIICFSMWTEWWIPFISAHQNEHIGFLKKWKTLENVVFSRVCGGRNRTRNQIEQSITINDTKYCVMTEWKTQYLVAFCNYMKPWQIVVWVWQAKFLRYIGCCFLTDREEPRWRFSPVPAYASRCTKPLVVPASVRMYAWKT